MATGPRALCHLPDRTVEIEGPPGLLRALLNRCDGATPLEEIVDELLSVWDAGDVSAFVDRLQSEGVLVDARDVAHCLWARIKNPQPLATDQTPENLAAAAEHAARQVTVLNPNARYFPVARTPLNTLLARRRSSRQFLRSDVPLANVVSALWSAYGVPRRRSVPSAGGIYPLQFHLLQLRAIAGLREGVYRVVFHERGKVGLERISARVDDAYAAWINPSILTQAQGVVVVSGDFARTAAKYGNRAALLVPLEAGHAAQNLLLAACELEFGVLELGGFIEDRLSAFLKQPKEVMPLLTIAYGATDDDAGVTEVGNDDFRWIAAGSAEYRPPFFLGASISETTDQEWCWGWSLDPRLAYAKTLAEARERTACATPQGLHFARYEELEHAVLPTRIAAYADAQYRRADFSFESFDPDRKYAWVEGEDHFTGKRTAVLADFVYYGSAMAKAVPGEKPYTSATTSGVAAFPDAEGALERAVLELMERHAFMTAWLHDIATPAITAASMPKAIQRRISALRDAGFNVVIKDYSFVEFPIAFVFAQNIARTLTRVGACAAYDAEGALDHALAEVECGVAVQLATSSASEMMPKDVRTPADHGALYSQPKYFRSADRLATFDAKTPLRAVGVGCPRNWQSLCDFLAARRMPLLKFHLGAASRKYGSAATPILHVMRAIVPGLTPISFGYGNEPLATSPFTGLASPRGHRPSVKARPLFPHPFS
jgi:ribosomal protein S12 methylthiotransferase accessory factor